MRSDAELATLRSHSHHGKDILLLSNNHEEVVPFPNDSNDVTYCKCRITRNTVY